MGGGGDAAVIYLGQLDLQLVEQLRVSLVHAVFRQARPVDNVYTTKQDKNK